MHNLKELHSIISSIHSNLQYQDFKMYVIFRYNLAVISNTLIKLKVFKFSLNSVLRNFSFSPCWIRAAHCVPDSPLKEN